MELIIYIKNKRTLRGLYAVNVLYSALVTQLLISFYSNILINNVYIKYGK